MAGPIAASGGPEISVLVPARNEEACLGTCLQSLTTQAGTAYEVIVVNDGSTDRTQEVAQSFAGVEVVDPGPLPAGWVGKNHALAAGAKMAKGKWLLFTDADTVHLPGSMARALTEAREQGAALLSYSPAQQVESFWERAIMPVVFGELAMRYHPSRVNEPGELAAANGQYLLISREAYEAVGGHTAVAGEVLEDVALAALVKRSGRKLSFRYGADTVRTRMYRSFWQLREGWTKNLAVLFPNAAVLSLRRGGEFLLIVGGLAASLGLAWVGLWQAAAASTTIAGIAGALHRKRIMGAHFSPGFRTVAGLPLFSYLLLRSRLHMGSEIEWKGRTYTVTSAGRAVTASARRGRAEHADPVSSSEG